ncbi:MAG: lipopolysaccharide biosynthesis regulator YciM [Lysobacterales bacterium]|jgi:lipopolysaccharide biosynthesis regulator YciM
MIENLLLVLVPVAAWAGWWFARHIMRRGERKRNLVFSNQYFQGLNYLLNEQPDKAIQVFLEMAEVNEDTVETHLALGSLFRKRGEVDRAIRLHQNIISKHNLNDTQRMQALLELGEDYMRAGLFDRAERLFSELTDRESHAPSALRHLLDIYQQEKDWGKALSIAAKLEKLTGGHLGGLMSHFCCELAELELKQQKPEIARKFLRQARRHDPESVRAHFIDAGIAEQKGNFDEALSVYEQIVELDSDYLPDLLDAYLQTATEAGEIERAAEQLERWAQDHEGISLVLHQASILEEKQGAEIAAKFILNSLRQRPSVKGLEKLMFLKKESEAEIDSGEDILHSITSELMASQSSHRCSHCGFSGHNHHWQCPSCKQWSTTRTIRGVLGE